MQIRQIADQLFVAPQLAPQHIAALKQHGFASVINNRPDGEGGAGQPSSAELAAAARAAGLDYRHLPVSPREHSDADARRMADLVDALPKPILAFCGSGARAAALYQKGQALGGGPAAA